VRWRWTRQAFNTLQLTEGSRAVLKGEQRGAAARIGVGPARVAKRAATSSTAPRHRRLPPTWGTTARPLCRLKAWRAEVAREHNLPAYVIFHDATLAAIAALAPPRWTICRGSAALGRRSWRPMGPEVLRVWATPACASRPSRRPFSAIRISVLKEASGD
jgi:ATP-dependent DNA helicase RecQ